MSDPMIELLDAYVRNKTRALLKLRADLNLVQGVGGIGPGAITRHPEVDGIYRIVTDIQQGQGPGATVIAMPFDFRAADVLWLSPGPQATEEQRRILVT